MTIKVYHSLARCLRPGRAFQFWSVLGLFLLLLPSGKVFASVAQATGSPSRLNLPFFGATGWALVVTAILYTALAWGVYSFYVDKNSDSERKQKSVFFGLKRLNPAVVTAGEYGQPSLSSLQLLFFTMIVVFMSVRSLFASSGLPLLSDTLLTLLAVPGVGKLSANFVSANRARLSLENWNYLIDEGVLRRGSAIDPVNTAHLKDLLLTDGVFDPARFQLLCASVLIGLAMLLGGDLSHFGLDIGSEAGKYNSWGWLLAGSNAIYIGGKAVAPSTIEELNQCVAALRQAKTKLLDNECKVCSDEVKSVARVLKSMYGNSCSVVE
jgi:hypothetical protein